MSVYLWVEGWSEGEGMGGGECGRRDDAKLFQFVDTSTFFKFFFCAENAKR